MRDFLRGPPLLEGPDTSRGLNIKKEYPATRQRTRKRTMNETRRRTSLIPFRFKSQVSVVPWTGMPRRNRYGESFFRRFDESENDGFSRRWVCRGEPYSSCGCVHVYVRSEGEEREGG